MDSTVVRDGELVTVRYTSAGVDRELRIPRTAWTALVAAVRAGTFDGLGERWVRWVAGPAIGFASLSGGQVHLLHGDRCPRGYRLPVSIWKSVTAAVRGDLEHRQDCVGHVSG